MKDKVGQILAALESLKTTGESSSAWIERIARSYPPMFNALSQSVPFPMYGLPPGYTPSVGDYSETEHALFSFPTTGNVPLIGTQGPVSVLVPMTSIGMNETATLVRTRVSVTPQTAHRVTSEDSSAKTIPYTTLHEVINNVDGARSRLEILEERLRIVEGVESHGFGDVARLSLVPGMKILQ